MAKRSVVLLFSFLFVLLGGFLGYQKLNSNLVASCSQSPCYKGDTQKSFVAFTVNVDWGGEYLPKMLNIFAENKVPATFFLTGRWASENPELVRQISEGKHELGNHGYSHPHVNNLSLEKNVEEITKTSAVINRQTGKTTRFFAPPYGEYNETVLKAAEETNHLAVMWTIDTVDWQKPSPECIASRVLDRLQNGAIILMHPTSSTIEALPAIIEGINEKGYKVKLLNDLFPEEHQEKGSPGSLDR